MENLLFSAEKLFLAIGTSEAWVPSHHFLVIVLFVGAFLTAGVALSVMSFYEDFYWGDKVFREELRLHPSKRKPSKQVKIS